MYHTFEYTFFKLHCGCQKKSCVRFCRPALRRGSHSTQSGGGMRVHMNNAGAESHASQLFCRSARKCLLAGLQVLTLAGPGVVLATALTACVVKFTFPSDYGWGWDSCLMMGGMLSATDPVAVVALLKELGRSKRKWKE